MFLTDEQRVKWEEWADALYSGKYQQARRAYEVGYSNETKRYCCLGVLCVINNVSVELANLRYSQKDRMDIFEKLLPNEGNFEENYTFDKFIQLNDSEQFTFEQIAHCIEMYLILDELEREEANATT